MRSRICEQCGDERPPLRSQAVQRYGEVVDYGNCRNGCDGNTWGGNKEHQRGR